MQVFEGIGPAFDAARIEQAVVEIACSPDLRGSTVQGAVGKIGSSLETATLSLATAAVIVGSTVYQTVLPTEWPGTGADAWVLVLVTYSDGRKTPYYWHANLRV